jgi:uncharacterized protein (TIGR03067 family)
MVRKFGLSVSCSLWFVVLLLPGCKRSQGSSANKTPSATTETKLTNINKSTDNKAPSHATSAKLLNINIAYCMFYDVNGRGPANVGEFSPYLEPTGFTESQRKIEEERLRELKKGDIVLVWNQKGVSEAMKGTPLMTAYEKRTAVQDGFVVFTNGHVEWKTPAELAQILQRVERISPETLKLKLEVPDQETMKSELEKALKKGGDEKSKEDLTRLQGLWEIVGIEHGKVALLGPAKVGDPMLVVGAKVHFKHKTWEGEYRFTLDATKNPKWIDTFDVKGEGEGIRGIYSLTQDEFRLCYDPSSSTRPAEFNTKVDFVRALFILKRVMPKQSLGKSGKVK